MAKRLGIMGGTFNPIHNGHLFVADIARRELDLDEVRFIPTGDSPHKRHVDVSGWQRLDMVRLAIAGHEGFTASDMELRRGGRSYTCDTVRQLHMTEPGSKLFFIMGGDMLATFTTWRNPDWIVHWADIAATPRPGDDGERIRCVCEYLRMEFTSEVHMLSQCGPDISSTEIRRRVCAGEDICMLVPPDVEKYILENGLYKALETENDV